MDAGESRAAGPGRIRDDHASCCRMVNAQHRQRRRRAGGARARARLRWHRAAARRDVGVPDRQHVRRGRVQLVRRVLDLLLRARDVQRRAASRPGDVGHAARPVSVGMGRSSPATCSLAALRVSGAVLLRVPAADGDVHRCWGSATTGGNTTITHWGGYVGIATAAAAWYASFGAVINSTFGQDRCVPLFPLST